MHEMSSNADIGKLFTKGRSYLNCNVILVRQNVFPKGPAEILLQCYSKCAKKKREKIKIKSPESAIVC